MISRHFSPLVMTLDCMPEKQSSHTLPLAEKLSLNHRASLILKGPWEIGG